MGSFRMTGDQFFLLCVLFSAWVSPGLSEDVECVKGEKSVSQILNNGDSSKFFTKGETYKKKQTCSSSYTLGDCAEATVTCDKFDVINKNDECTKGDKLTIQDSNDSTTSFCKSTGPVDFRPSGDFSLKFKLDKKQQGAGISCTVECADSSGGGSGGPGNQSLPFYTNNYFGICFCFIFRSNY